jgi:copper homeostasis protein
VYYNDVTIKKLLKGRYKQAMTRILVEACCGSLEEACLAKTAGADRIELNSMLSCGGLTPTMGLVELVRELGIETLPMVRPRPGNFCYSDFEFKTMLADTRLFRDAGMDGIVFGILNPDGTVDRERCRQLLQAAGNLTAVFHMAVDQCPNWRAALDTICELKFKRVLRRGQKENAWEGRETLREMQDYAAGRIEILPGGGIREHNVRQVIQATGCTQVHFSMRKPGNDELFLTEAELRDLIDKAR